MLNAQQLATLDDLALLANNVIANVGAADVTQAKNELVTRMQALTGKTATVGDTIQSGLKVLDDAAYLSKNTKFEDVANVLLAADTAINNSGALSVVGLFKVLFKK